MMRRLAMLLTLAGALSLAAAGSAGSQSSGPVPESEPNDSILQADGPLQAGTYTGQTQFRANDFYVFVVPRNGTATVEGPSCLEQWPTGENTWRRLSAINPVSAPAVVLLRASECGDYSFKVTGDVTLDPASLTEAAGPLPDPSPIAEGTEPYLLGGIGYTATLDAGDDSDSFFFRLAAGTEVRVTLAAGDAGCSRGAQLIVWGGAPQLGSATNGAYSDFVVAEANQMWGAPARASATAETRIRGVVDGGCAGLPYFLKITPSANVLAPPPPTPAPTPTPDDGLKTVSTRLTFARSGKRYSGRVISSNPACVGERRITIRKRGRGTKAFARLASSAGGTYSVKRKSRIGGRIYAVALPAKRGTTFCGEVRSGVIRG